MTTISTQTSLLTSPKTDNPLARVASLLSKNDDETDLSSSEDSDSVESEGVRVDVRAEHSEESSDDSSDDEINVHTYIHAYMLMLFEISAWGGYALWVKQERG